MLTRREHDVAAIRERACLHGPRQLIGLPAGVDANCSEVVPHALFEEGLGRAL
jgi:hypothetical protein